MTQREFLNKVIATNGIADEVKAEAEALIAKLDNKNEQRKGKQTKVQKENEPIAKAIVEYLTDKGAVLGVDIATALNLSTNKVNGVAGTLWKEGVLVKGKAKVKGKGEMTTYALAVVAADEGEVEETAEDTAEVSAE
jgi:single-stranded DNA-specific DHH superfamily exonuclease